MKPPILDLLRLPDNRLFAELSVGIQAILENANSLEATAVRLIQGGEHRAASIIRALATEESAKVLILVDFVRCPHKAEHKDKRTATLKAFRSHLAKGIYADSCHWRPAHYGELMNIVKRTRRGHYLDGPNDVDWIFPNEVLSKRLNRMYVDYVWDITHRRGDHQWTSPPDACDLGSLSKHVTPACLVVTRAMHRVGMTTPKGLSILADVWRDFQPTQETTSVEFFGENFHTLALVTKAQSINEIDHHDASTVCYRWPFPLWPLDLTESKSPTIEELRCWRSKEIRRRMRQESERDPPPSVTREQIVSLTNAHNAYRTDVDHLIASYPQRKNSRLKIVPADLFTRKTESYRKLRRMVCDITLSQLQDLAALGWFAREVEGWTSCHRQARRVISKDSVDYVCGLGHGWLAGLERWESPPQLPPGLVRREDE